MLLSHGWNMLDTMFVASKPGPPFSRWVYILVQGPSRVYVRNQTRSPAQRHRDLGRAPPGSSVIGNNNKIGNNMA